MNDHEVKCDWKGNKQFNATVNNHDLILDDRFESMGTDMGPRPKPLMLAALAGCNGMNVVSVLKKMRFEFDALRVTVKGELTDTAPNIKKFFCIFISKEKNWKKKNWKRRFNYLRKNIAV